MLSSNSSYQQKFSGVTSQLAPCGIMIHLTAQKKKSFLHKTCQPTLSGKSHLKQCPQSRSSSLRVLCCLGQCLSKAFKHCRTCYCLLQLSPGKQAKGALGLAEMESIFFLSVAKRALITHQCFSSACTASRPYPSHPF